jgi:hypothetical protein
MDQDGSIVRLHRSGSELANKSVEHGMATFMDSIFEVNVSNYGRIYISFPHQESFGQNFGIKSDFVMTEPTTSM